MRFEPRPKPDGFKERVEDRGATWLASNGTGRPPAYWLEFRPQLADAFGSLCAYGVMFEPVGTVDHFVSVDEDRSKSYDWTNYRFAAGWINSSKQSLESAQIIDPFLVQDEWFEVQLPSMQLVLTQQVPQEERERAQFVLDRLHLGHDERVIRQRREWCRMYQEGELDLVGLTKKAPLIVWYDERAEFRPFVDEVRGGPRVESTPVPVSVAGTKASLAEHAGSMFELRSVVERLVSADQPDLLRASSRRSSLENDIEELIQGVMRRRGRSRPARVATRGIRPVTRPRLGTRGRLPREPT